MKPRPFAGQNLTYLAPEPWVGDLHCRRVEPGVILSVWELTSEERAAIAAGADIELVVMAEPLPPVSLTVHQVTPSDGADAARPEGC